MDNLFVYFNVLLVNDTDNQLCRIEIKLSFSKKTCGQVYNTIHENL